MRGSASGPLAGDAERLGSVFADPAVRGVRSPLPAVAFPPFWFTLATSCYNPHWLLGRSRLIRPDAPHPPYKGGTRRGPRDFPPWISEGNRLVGSGAGRDAGNGCRGGRSEARRAAQDPLGEPRSLAADPGQQSVCGLCPFHGDLGQRMVAYFTPERIMQTLDEAADLGVTAVASPPDPKWIDLYHRYLDQGGKLKIWIAQSHGSPKKMLDEITLAAKGGAKAIFVQGHRVEEQFGQGKMDVLRSWMEHIKSFGLPAGMAAHWPTSTRCRSGKTCPPISISSASFRADQRPENYDLSCRDRAVETIHSLTKKPVVAYKILVPAGCGRKRPSPTPSSTSPLKTGSASASIPSTTPACWSRTSPWCRRGDRPQTAIASVTCTRVRRGGA